MEPIIVGALVKAGARPVLEWVREVLGNWSRNNDEAAKESHQWKQVRIPVKPGHHSGGCRATVPVHAGPVSEAV
jgi:hypothetical protein